MVERTQGENGLSNLLFAGVNNSQMWMSHGDKVTRLPNNFVTIAKTDNSANAAIASLDKKMFGLQFHPEVVCLPTDSLMIKHKYFQTHSINGKDILKNFVVGICAAPEDWILRDIANDFIAEVCSLYFLTNGKY